jgi:hypothetical protein
LQLLRAAAQNPAVHGGVSCLLVQHYCHTKQRFWHRLYIPLGLALFRPSYKEPVVDVAKRIWHEWLRFIVAPLTIHNKFVLMITA